MLGRKNGKLIETNRNSSSATHFYVFPRYDVIAVELFFLTKLIQDPSDHANRARGHVKLMIDPRTKDSQVALIHTIGVVIKIKKVKQ